MEILWVTHAWFQIKSRGTVVQVDPSDIDVEHLKSLPRGVEKADLILITHHHSDHCNNAFTALLVKEGTKMLAPKLCADKMGGKALIMKPGETFSYSGIAIKAVDSYNTPEGASTVKAHRKGECLGYLITAESKTVYHAGDTDLIPEMASLGHVDLALLPVGGTYTMDVKEAARAVSVLKPQIVIPMHRIGADAKDFAEKVGGVAAVRTLSPGETISLA